MYQCKQCGVTVKTESIHCPLCHSLLDGDPSNTEQTYPMFQARKEHRLQIEGFAAFIMIIAHVMINLIVTPALLWCIPSCATVLYFWLLVVLNRKGRMRHGITGKYHLLPVTALLILYNLYVNEAGPVLSWYPTYGLAFCLALSLLINNGWMLLSRHCAFDILPSQIIISILGMIPVYLVVIRVIAFSWASVGTAALSLGTLVFILIVYRARTKMLLQSYFYALS